MKHKDYAIVRSNLADVQDAHQFRQTVLRLLNEGYYCIGGPAIDQYQNIVQALGKLDDAPDPLEET